MEVDLAATDTHDEASFESFETFSARAQPESPAKDVAPVIVAMYDVSDDKSHAIRAKIAEQCDKKGYTQTWSFMNHR